LLNHQLFVPSPFTPSKNFSFPPMPDLGQQPAPESVIHPPLAIAASFKNMPPPLPFAGFYLCLPPFSIVVKCETPLNKGPADLRYFDPRSFFFSLSSPLTLETLDESDYGFFPLPFFPPGNDAGPRKYPNALSRPATFPPSFFFFCPGTGN